MYFPFYVYYFFWVDKGWTLKQSFNFEKRRESLRHWTLKRFQVIFDEKKLVMNWFYLGFVY